MASTSGASSAPAKSREYAARAAADTAASAEATMKEWSAREEEKVQQLQSARSAISAASPSSFVQYLQTVRRLTKRPSMTVSEIALIPQDQAFLNAVVEICQHPLTAKLEQEAGLAEETEDEMKVEGQAVFYIRQFRFASKERATTLLEAALKKAPQYVYIVARIKAELKLLPDSSTVGLCYGGFSIAQTARGRCVDDGREDGGSLIKVLLDLYEDPIKIFSFPSLSFAAEDVIAARADPRTHLFESLVVDSFGLVCANTAPPGQYLQLAISPAVQASLDFLKTYKPDPKLFERFKALKLQSEEASVDEATGGSSSTKAVAKSKAKTKTKAKPALAEKDKNAGGAVAKEEKTKAKGKGKGKGKAEEDPVEKGKETTPKKKRSRDAPLVSASPNKKTKTTSAKKAVKTEEVQ